MSENNNWADPKKTRCLICDTVGEWENVDKYKLKPTGMVVCKHCGFGTHLCNLKSKEELTEYYKKEYRPAPTSGNLFTGQTKLNYHEKFLRKTMDKWPEKGKDITVGEVGSAYGLFLGWMKSQYPEIDYNGVELTQSYKNVAYHQFGLELKDELDFNKKYDLICSYKVAEHQMDVDKELREYAKALKENGQVYISVPIWFKRLNSFGAQGWDIEYYYHTNHINIWDESNFETLLKKAGLEVIEKDTHIYDNTYLCKRNDDLMQEKPVYYGYEKAMDSFKRVFEADQLLKNKKPLEATRVWPNFPYAHLMLMETTRQKNHNYIEEHGFDKFKVEVLQRMLKDTDDDVETLGFAADVCRRYEDYGEAVKLIDYALNRRPGVMNLLIMRARCYAAASRSEKDNPERIKMINEAIGTLKFVKAKSIQHFPQATDMIYKIESELPVNSNASV